MNKLTQEMIDAGATALCGLTRAQAKDELTMKRFNDGCEKAQWLWTLMTAAAPKGSSDEPTLRDRFATKAMHAAMTSRWVDIGYKPADGLDDMRQNARLAYQMDDAMLAERAL